MRVETIVGIALAALLLISPAYAFDIVREDRDSWVCVDYAVDYARNNPGYQVLVISNHMYFWGGSHYVAAKVNEDQSLSINNTYYDYDKKEWISCDYVIAGEWYSDEYTFYHFFGNDQPIRNYSKRGMRDNRELVM